MEEDRAPHGPLGRLAVNCNPCRLGNGNASISASLASVDFDTGYKTMDKTFMESVWWVFKQCFDKGLIYQGYRIQPYSPALATPLSNFETNQGYKDRQDPSLTLIFPINSDKAKFKDTSILVWTTTPWTLYSNFCIVVGPDMDYILVEQDGKKYWIAASRTAAYFKNPNIVDTCKGADLVGKDYEPLSRISDEYVTPDQLSCHYKIGIMGGGSFPLVRTSLLSTPKRRAGTDSGLRIDGLCMRRERFRKTQVVRNHQHRGRKIDKAGTPQRRIFRAVARRCKTIFQQERLCRTKNRSRLLGRRGEPSGISRNGNPLDFTKFHRHLHGGTSARRKRERPVALFPLRHRLGGIYVQAHQGTQENHEGRGMGTALRQVQGRNLRFQVARQRSRPPHQGRRRDQQEGNLSVFTDA